MDKLPIEREMPFPTCCCASATLFLPWSSRALLPHFAVKPWKNRKIGPRAKIDVGSSCSIRVFDVAHEVRWPCALHASSDHLEANWTKCRCWVAYCPTCHGQGRPVAVYKPWNAKRVVDTSWPVTRPCPLKSYCFKTRTVMKKVWLKQYQ